MSESLWLPAGDGVTLHVAHWPAADAPKAAVACLHGIQSHAGWYDQSCVEYARRGLDVYFLDRRGSGQSKGERGWTPGPTRLVDDVIEFLDWVRGRGARSVFLHAVSWGGKLALAALKRRPDAADGLILLCPGWFPKVSPPLLDRLRIAAAALLRPHRLFDIPLSDPALFTDNPERRDFLKTDSLSLHRGTARLLASSRLLDRMIADAPARMTTPSLLVLAGQDRIIKNAPTRAFFERFAAVDKQCLEFPAGCHTLEFEPHPQPIFTAVADWILAHAS